MRYETNRSFQISKTKREDFQKRKKKIVKIPHRTTMRRYSRCDHRFLVFVQNENRGVSFVIFPAFFLSQVAKDEEDFPRNWNNT